MSNKKLNEDNTYKSLIALRKIVERGTDFKLDESPNCDG